MEKYAKNSTQEQRKGRYTMKKRGILLVLVFILALTSMVGISAADGAGEVVPENIKSGITFQVLRESKRVEEIVVGDMIQLEVWVYDIAPQAIVLPIKFNPKVLQVVDKRQGENTYTPVTSGFKSAEDKRVGNAGFQTYSKPTYDTTTWEPTYWNGSVQFYKSYPYVNNETGIYKFFFWSDNPFTAKQPNKKMSINFRAIGEGDCGIGIATKADGDHLAEDDVDGRSEYYDVSSAQGAVVAFPNKDMYLPAESMEFDPSSAVLYTDLINKVNCKVVSAKPNFSQGSGIGSSGSATAAPVTTPKPSPTPTPGPPELKTELVAKPTVAMLPLKETISIKAAIKPNANNEITNNCEYMVVPRELESLLNSEDARKAKDIVVEMPDEILQSSQYIVNIRTIYFRTMDQKEIKNIYFNTPYGTVAMLIPSFLRTKSLVDGELKFVVSGGEGSIRVSAFLDGTALEGVKTGRIAKIAIPYETQTPDKIVMTHTRGDATYKIPLSCYLEKEKLVYAMYTEYGNFAVEQSGSSTFTDLDTVQWAQESIALLADKGVINGVSETIFAPDNQVTREEFAKMLVEAFGLLLPEADSEFTDVEDGSWYEPYVASATNAEITKGISETEFGIGQQISREDMATMVERAMVNVGLYQPQDTKDDIVIGDEEEKFQFADDDQIASYAKDAVYRMQKEEILSGKENNLFDPKGYATRAEAAKIIGLVFRQMLQQIQPD